jgi:Fe-S cluster biogenesis protein NfuA
MALAVWRTWVGAKLGTLRLPSEKEKSVEEQVRAVINELRPALQADGGDIEFVGIAGKTVQVRLTGACRGCPHAQMTLTMGVENQIKKRVPGVEKVVAVQ